MAGVSKVWFPALALTSLVSACSEPELELLVPQRPVPQAVAGEIAQLSQELDSLEKVEIRAEVGEGALANLEAVAAGEADLAIVPNSVEYRPGVRSIAVLYEGVLHTLHRRDSKPGDFGELVTGADIYAGPEGSVERWLLGLFADRFGVSPGDYRVVNSLDEAEVLFVFGPIMAELHEAITTDWRFYSVVDAEDLGTGSPIESVPLLHPQLQPFVIPAQTYPALDHGAVVSLSVDMLLVGREDLDEDEVYALARGLSEQRRRFANASPAVFAGLRAEPAHASATFALHEGARQYFHRDEPSFAERYAELIGVVFSMFVACISGLVAFSQWRQRRRKNRIDVYYAEVWAVRKRIAELDADARSEAATELRALEAKAFEALIAEELAADEAFRIFVTLINDTIRELRA